MIVLVSSCIRVKSHREIYRNIKSFFVRINRRTARHIVYPHATIYIIIAIIVFARSRRIYGVGNSCPLHIISRTFCKTRVSAGYIRKVFVHFVFWRIMTGNITYSSSETYCVCSDYSAFFVGNIAKHYFVFIITTCREIKSAKIYPCTSTHGLVYFELGGNSFMEHCVRSVFRAVFDGMIGNIHGIFSCFFD